MISAVSLECRWTLRRRRMRRHVVRGGAPSTDARGQTTWSSVATPGGVLDGPATAVHGWLPAPVRNLLLPASSHYQLDFFYVGPADRSFERGAVAASASWTRLEDCSARLLGLDRAPPSWLAGTARWFRRQHTS